MKVLQAFIKNMDFSGESFEKSLRKLLAGFRLPGESQKIERIMEIFSEVYTGQQVGFSFSFSFSFILEKFLCIIFIFY